MPVTNKVKIYQTLSLLVVFLLLSLFIIFPKTTRAEIISDNFDSHSVGALAGQSNWKYMYSSGTTPVQNVSTAQVYSAPNSIFATTGNNRVGFDLATSTPITRVRVTMKTHYSATSGSGSNRGSSILGEIGNLAGGITTEVGGSSIGRKRDGTITRNQGNDSTSGVLSTGWNDLEIVYDKGATFWTTTIILNSVTVSTATSSSSFASPINYFALGGDGGWNLLAYSDNISITTNADAYANTTSRIDTMTYATSTNEVTITGYMNYLSPESYNRDELKIYQTDVLGIHNEDIYLPTSSGLFTYVYDYNGIATASSTIAFGYDIKVTAELSRLDNRYYDPFGTEALDPTNTLYRTLLQDEEVIIGVDSYVGLVNTSTIEGIYSLPEFSCGLTELTGCLKNAFVWLLYPSPSSLAGITGLKDKLEYKFPFAYIFDFKNSIDSLYTGTQTQSATISFDFAGLGTLTLLSEQMLEDVPFASTLKITLGYLLWFIFAVTMYRRTLKIFDHNTTPQ